MLYYVQSKTLSEQNKTYAYISLSPTLTIPEPLDDAVFKFPFKSNHICLYIYGTQMMLLMLIFKSLCIFKTGFDTFGDDKYKSYVEI